MMNGKPYSVLMLPAVLLLSVGCTHPGPQGVSITTPAQLSEEVKSEAQKSTTAPVAAKTTAPEEQAKAEKKPFDMDVLIERLKETAVIGFFSKMALRSDALDLVDAIEQFKASGSQPETRLTELHASFNGLLLKVLALLNDDPVLAQNIRTAQNEIWSNLLEVNT